MFIQKRWIILERYIIVVDPDIRSGSSFFCLKISDPDHIFLNGFGPELLFNVYCPKFVF